MEKKRIWLFVPAALIPYFSLGVMAFIFSMGRVPASSWIMEHLFNDNIFYFVLVFLVYLLVATVLGVICFVKSIREKWEPVSLAKTVMWIKLIQIPAYVAIYVLGVVMAITLFTIPFAFVLFLLDCLAVAMTGLMNLSAVIGAYREGKTTLKKSWWVIVLQGIFCADVVASVIFYRMLKKQDQQMAA